LKTRSLEDRGLFLSEQLRIKSQEVLDMIIRVQRMERMLNMPSIPTAPQQQNIPTPTSTSTTITSTNQQQDPKFHSQEIGNTGSIPPTLPNPMSIGLLPSTSNAQQPSLPDLALLTGAVSKMNNHQNTSTLPGPNLIFPPPPK